MIPVHLCRNALPKFDKSVSFVCWAYNEEELIEGFLRRIHGMLEEHVEDYEMVVVDDASTDGTNEIIREVQKEIPAIVLFRNDRNMNVGYSFHRAVREATREFVFWQTVDWSYDISRLRVFLELLKQYDIVAGVRFEPVRMRTWTASLLVGVGRLFCIKHLTRRSDTVQAAIVSVINFLLVRILFGVRLSDFQNVVFYPREVIQSIRFESQSSFANPEGLLKAHWMGKSIVEVPISFIPRTAGTAKGVTIRTLASSVSDIVRLWFRWMVKGERECAGKGEIRRLVASEWR